MPGETDRDYLRRLPPEYYRGQAYVHWSLTMQDRKEGWLKPILLYKFRELLTHTTFRYALCCPIFCLMPDHLHMMWIGILDGSDQLPAIKHFRKRFNESLDKIGYRLQEQAYDHVLRDDERQEHAFTETCEYIARNPERAGLVEVDQFATYKYSSCIVPGYPELEPFQSDYWERFWRAYSYMRTNGLLRVHQPDSKP